MIRALLAQPFLYMTVWFAICLQIPKEYVFIFLASVLLVFPSIYFYFKVKYKSEFNGLLYLVLLSMLFAFRWYAHQQENHPEDVPKILNMDRQMVSIKEIESVDSLIQLTVNIDLPEKSYSARIKVARQKDSASFFPGDHIMITGKLIRPSPSFQFDPFDYAEYLEHKHIQYINRDEIRIYDPHNPSTLNIKKLAYQAKIYICHLLLESIPNKEYGGLLVAILVGDKGLVSERIKNQFIATGTAHILAVSGMHLGMLYAMLTFLMNSFSKNFPAVKKSQTSIILILIWFFAFITGLSPAILRAAVMFSLLEVGVYLRRKTHGLNILFGSAFLMMYHNPCILKDIGFQLSFMAVLSILMFQAPIMKLLRSSNKIWNYIAEIAGVSLAVQFLITPISSFYFGSFPTYFLLTNIVWVPLSFILMILGIIILLLSTVYLPIGMVIGNCCAWSIQAGLFFFDLVEKWPLYKLDRLIIYPEQLLLIYLSFLSLFLWIKFHFKAMLFAAVLFLISLTASYPIRILKFSKETEWVFHSKNKESILDIRTGLKVFSFIEKDQLVPGLNYYHLYHQIKEREIIRLDQNFAYTFSYDSDSLSWNINWNKIKNDQPADGKNVLLIRNAKSMDTCMLLDYRPDLVVLCRQNPPYLIRQMTEFLHAAKLTYVDLRTGTQMIKY